MESRNPSPVLGRYIGAMDRVVAEQSELDQLLELFAPEAVVDLDGTAVEGVRAVRELYERFAAAHRHTAHLWDIEVLPDGRQRAQWVCAARTSGGSLIAVSGVEYATVDARDRIVHLRNEITEN